jgi:hypothetical protein
VSNEKIEQINDLNKDNINFIITDKFYVKKDLSTKNKSNIIYLKGSDASNF